jgi:hypothetical protein
LGAETEFDVAASGDVVHTWHDDEEQQAAARLRERRRKARRRKIRNLGWRNLLVLVVGAAASMVFLAMIADAYADYRFFQTNVQKSELRLEALDEQYRMAQNRLARLDGDNGKKEILVEKGYVRPGERILLFPANRRDQAAATEKMTNDLAPHPAIENRPTGSSWQRAGRSLRQWWAALRGQKVEAPTP